MKVLTILFLSLFISSNAAQRPSSDMVQGEVSNRHVKYMVSVREYNRHICGGVILNNNHILTAASCVKNKIESSITVRVGNSQHSLGRAYFIKNITTHDLYDPKTSAHDLAIITVSSYIIFNANTQPITIINDNPESERLLTVYGWGVEEGSVLVRYLRSLLVRYLRSLEMTTIPYEHCKAAMKIQNLDILNEHLCAFSEAGRGICNGDEGGPAVGENGKLVGIITKKHRGECANGFPDVFTNLYYYKNWVEVTIKGIE